MALLAFDVVSTAAAFRYNVVRMLDERSATVSPTLVVIVAVPLYERLVFTRTLMKLPIPASATMNDAFVRSDDPIETCESLPAPPVVL